MIEDRAIDENETRDNILKCEQCENTYTYIRRNPSTQLDRRLKYS